jgi:hypothetical protein
MRKIIMMKKRNKKWMKKRKKIMENSPKETLFLSNNLL